MKGMGLKAVIEPLNQAAPQVGLYPTFLFIPVNFLLFGLVCKLSNTCSQKYLKLCMTTFTLGSFKNPSWVQWQTPVNPATQKAAAGGLQIRGQLG